MERFILDKNAVNKIPNYANLYFNVLLCEGNVRDPGWLGHKLTPLQIFHRGDVEGIHPLFLLFVPNSGQGNKPNIIFFDRGGNKHA